jgi:hypothetical protein
VVEDLPPAIEMDVIPAMLENTAAPKGVRIVAAGIRKHTEWRRFLHCCRSRRYNISLICPRIQATGRHYTSSGHIPWQNCGSGDGPSDHLHYYWSTMAKRLGRRGLECLHHCPPCGILAGTEEPLERHMVRCPNGGTRHRLHDGLVGVIKSILKDAGVPDASLVV